MASLYEKVFNRSRDEVKDLLLEQTPEVLEGLMDFAKRYHAEDQFFWIFDALVARGDFDKDMLEHWLDKEPLLVFVLLKRWPPSDELMLPTELTEFCLLIVKSVIRSANAVPIACLVAFEKLSASIATLDLPSVLELLELAALSVRSTNIAQEVLLVLLSCREPAMAASTAMAYAHKHALALCFEHVEEAAEECPCDEEGKPTRQRTAPIQTFVIYYPLFVNL